MSASLRKERVWYYAPNPVGEDDAQAITYALAPSTQPDGAYWAAYAPQEGRESTIALRRTAVGRAVFTVDDGVPVAEVGLVRLQRTGTLYTITGTRHVPTARELVFDGETVERGQYPITADVPAHTAAAVIVTPGALTLSVGTVRILRATVTNAAALVLPERPVRWDSSDRAVALIFATGRLETIGPGTATITATADDGGPGVVGTMTVTVT